MVKKKSRWGILNVVIALIVFSFFTGLLFVGAVFDFYSAWKINSHVSAITLLIGAVISLTYLIWALLNWRLSKIFK